MASSMVDVENLIEEKWFWPVEAQDEEFVGASKIGEALSSIRIRKLSSKYLPNVMDKAHSVIILSFGIGVSDKLVMRGQQKGYRRGLKTCIPSCSWLIG